MSISGVNLEDFLIPFEDIKLATGNFSDESRMDSVIHAYLYRGQLSERWKNRTAVFKCFWNDFDEQFHNELKFISRFNHDNIIPFIGYCDEDDREGFVKTIVYEVSVNGSRLDDHFTDPSKRSCLTWARRLLICLDVAKGLKYLHSGLGEYGSVIHRFVIKSIIFLDDNFKAKLSGFDLSVSIPGNQPSPQVYEPFYMETDKYSWRHDLRLGYMDPIYRATGILKADADVYSFGVLMFDILNKSYDHDKNKYNEDKLRNRIMLVRECYENGLENLIDLLIKDQIGGRSFHMISELAYKCICYNTKDRPTLDTIIKTIEEALEIHIQGGVVSANFLIIPFADIKLATGNFSENSLLKSGSFKCSFYKGQLSESWQNRKAVFQSYMYYDSSYDQHIKFANNLELVSRFRHKNTIPYIGHCDEDHKQHIVFEHAINGNLQDHLQDPDKRRCFTWVQRLKICIGSAKGLKCLHGGLGKDYRVVHKRVESKFILLDENMEAKICHFDESVKVFKSLPRESDPKNHESPIDDVEVDVYSFGLIMLEMLSGMKRSKRKGFHEVDADRRLEIDPCIRDQIDSRSLSIYSETAYRCLNPNMKERPSMIRIIKKIEEALYIQNQGGAASITTFRSQQYQKLEDLLIPLKEINMATRNFNESSKIGVGGFSVVYKGQLSQRWPNHQVAIKRLAKKGLEGETEFRSELELNFKFHHQNIVPFIGYCDEGEEKILVYVYASNGSLHHHLQKRKKRHCLTWANRLKICLGAAKALDYLHAGLGENNKVIHRDIKSGNILLDENLEAKICDFGLSKSDSKKQQKTKVYTNAAGTNFYMDPIYHESGMLRSESDVYSFGVVMFEMLSGLPAWCRRNIGNDKPQLLMNLVRRYYDYGKDLLIDPIIKDQVDYSSFHSFIEIAYQCISFNSKERPTMETVVDRIEEALDFQVSLVNFDGFSYVTR